MIRMQRITIPKGTKLYRCAPTLNKELRECSDTGKRGMYFSTYILQALAMCVEYNKSMLLGIFELQQDIIVFVGKYSYRELNPSYYYCFSCFNTNAFIRNCKVHEDDNISHFDPEMYCILGFEYDMLLCFGRLKNEPLHGEVFIAKEDELENIQLITQYRVPLNGLLPLFSKMKYVPNCDEYISFLEEVN